MTKKLSKKISITLLCVIFMSICLPGLAADPGSSEDPLITLSYVEDILMPQVKSYVESKLGSVEAGTGSVFEVVNLKKGQTVIAAKSTEFILRMGSASIVATKKGGISDVTAGIDLQNGSQMPANHLLIVPLDDGRGLTMQTDGIVMIRGNYSIK